MSTNSRILDNKQLIHIASEVVVITGLVFYFSSKNRKLMEHIEELAQKVEEQEDHIQKLEQGMHRLSEIVSRLVPSNMPLPPVNNLYKNNVKQNPNKQHSKQFSKAHAKHSKSPKNQQQKSQQLSKEMKDGQPVLINEPKLDKPNIEETEHESDLDNEIRQELDELEIETDDDVDDNEEEKDDSNLKKQ